MSPTKQMDFSNPRRAGTTPLFASRATDLNRHLAEYGRDDLKKLMTISSRLTEETATMIRSFGTDTTPRNQALFSYNGTAFKALDPETLDGEALTYAQGHLRILSGLYGILRPRDVISPYRLEMKTRLRATGGSLSAYWKTLITEAIAEEEHLSAEDDVVIDLTSAEYAQAVDFTALSRKTIRAEFKDEIDGELRTVGMYAKAARGLMVRRILQERPKEPGALRKGSVDGYRFDRSLSTEKKWVFVRRTAE